MRDENLFKCLRKKFVEDLVPFPHRKRKQKSLTKRKTAIEIGVQCTWKCKVCNAKDLCVNQLNEEENNLNCIEKNTNINLIHSFMPCSECARSIRKSLAQQERQVFNV